MSTNSTEDDVCAPDDNLCTVRRHQLAVIIVPSLLLGSTLLILVVLLSLRFCPRQRRARARTRTRTRTRARATGPLPHLSSSHRQTQRRHLHGIDAPPGLDPLEHEALPMSARAPAVREITSGGFGPVSALPLSFSNLPGGSVSLLRGHLRGKAVVLRVLRETASGDEQQHFLGFASFLSGLGSCPFIPALLGVVSARPPLTLVVEELQRRDLLGFLWRCRQDNSGAEGSCDLTEKRIFIMAAQVASALDFLHGRRCLHGNLGARSVLVAGDLTAKLWGLGAAYRRGASSRRWEPGEAEHVEMRKWQAPEVLARTGFSECSDVWSFGILLYEMVTLGDPPFPEILATDVLRHLQRGGRLRRPTHCSASLFSVVTSCCQRSPERRPSAAELVRKLQGAERSADGTTVLRAPRPVDMEAYLREAGYGEAYNYAVL